jgi:hypothetical protein
MSANEWMDKENMIYLQYEILFSLKKKEILSFSARWVNMEDVMLSEVSQA